MYNAGWAKSRRALDCFFIFMAEILGGYRQILDRSGKKITLLSPLFLSQSFSNGALVPLGGHGTVLWGPRAEAKTRYLIDE